MLINSIRCAGVVPSLGVVEFAADLIGALDLERAGDLDPSLGRFLDEVNAIFKTWHETPDQFA